MPRAYYALSIRQPWAALLAHGVKTIEVRRWPTRIRGPVLIHAAKTPDERPTGWSLLPPAAHGTAELRGGIIALAELVGCRAYRDAAAFAADQPHHCNLPEWFHPPLVYGFVFAGVRLVRFRPCVGNVRFFSVAAGDVAVIGGAKSVGPG